MNTIANIENVVCSAGTKSQHPVLYHYTNNVAFESIVASQTLWCSHYREMLDTNEVRLMRDLLPPAFAPRMDAIAKTFNRKSRRIWEAAGGGAKTARDLVNALYGATFDGAAVYSAMDPYLFSFSTHAEDRAFDREYGIQSQWTGYAGSEGYCLVFDIGAVAEMLKREGEARYWHWLTLEPVRYADRPVDEIFPELVLASAETLRQFVVDGVKEPEMAIPAFLNGTTLLKGASYKLEREVRIVAIPGTAETARHAAAQYPSEFDASMPLPEIKMRPSTGKRYVALFEGLGLRLPIKRVIIGPGTRQEERAERARSVLGDVPVTISLCP